MCRDNIAGDKSRCGLSAIAACVTLRRPRDALHRNTAFLSCPRQERGCLAPGECCHSQSCTNFGAIVLMSGFRAQSACIALVIAGLAPLLVGCDEPKSAVAAVQASDPDVSVVTVNPQARAVVR